MFLQMKRKYSPDHKVRESSFIKLPRMSQYFYEYGAYWFTTIFGDVWICFPGVKIDGLDFIELIDPSDIYYVLEILFELIRILSLIKFLAQSKYQTDTMESLIQDNAVEITSLRLISNCS